MATCVAQVNTIRWHKEEAQVACPCATWRMHLQREVRSSVRDVQWARRPSCAWLGVCSHRNIYHHIPKDFLSLASPPDKAGRPGHTVLSHCSNVTGLDRPASRPLSHGTHAPKLSQPVRALASPGFSFAPRAGPFPARLRFCFTRFPFHSIRRTLTAGAL